MKESLITMMIVVAFASAMTSCGHKVTLDDAKKAEATLFKTDQTVNDEVIPKVVNTFCQYAEDNPKDSLAPEYMFKALEVSVNFMEPEKAIEIGNKMFENYPDYSMTPVGMFLLASMVYEDKYKDLDKARELYEKIINDYPENDFVPSARQAIKNLGKTPEELVKEFEQMNDTVQQPE